MIYFTNKTLRHWLRKGGWWHYSLLPCFWLNRGELKSMSGTVQEQHLHPDRHDPKVAERPDARAAYRLLTMHKRPLRVDGAKIIKFAWMVAVLFLLLKISGYAQNSVSIDRVGGAKVTSAGLPVAQATGTNLHIVCDAGCGGAASFTDSSAFTFATTSVNNISAVVDDIATNTVAENAAGAVRMNANRILYVDLSKSLANTNKFLVTADPITFASPQHTICDSGCGGAATFSDAAAFTAGTTSINVDGGLFDDTPPTALTAGKAAAPRITANRAFHVNLRNQAGTELGTAAAPLQVSLANTAANATAVTVGQATGTNLHTVVDSGTITGITNALPAGTNVIGHVIADTGSTTAVTGSVAVTNANLDVALSTRLKPADTLTGVTTVGAVTSITNPVAITAASLPAPLSVTATGNITSNQAITVSTSAAQTVVMNVSGTWTGTIQPQVSVDGTTFSNVGAIPFAPTGASVATITANGNYFLVIGGSAKFQLLGATVASGTAVITIAASPAGFAQLAVQSTAANLKATVVQATGNNLHSVIDTGSTTAVTQATGTNLHAVIDTGSTTAVTQPTGTNLHMVCDSGCGGAASFSDSAAFTFATTSVNNISAVVDDVATNSVAENSAGAVRMNGSRILYVDLSKTAANTNKLLVTPDSVALPANQSVNVSQINGVTPLMGTGVMGTGSPRVTIASDNDPLTVKQATGTNLHAVIDTGSTTAVTQATGSNLHAVLDANSGVDIGKLTANQSTNLAQVAGTTTDVNSGTKSNGTLRVVLATDQPALTNKLLVTPDSVALPANQSVNVSQINAVTPLMGNGVTGTGSPRVTIASDNTANTNPWLVEDRQSTKAAFSAAKNGLASATTATDIFYITGSGTKTVRVLRIGISGTATTTLTTPFLLIKRSAANTSGTCASATVVPNDSGNAAGTAVVTSCTGNPTLGAAVGTVAAATVTMPVSATGNSNQPTIFDFGMRGGQPIVLRGTSEVLAVNLNSVTVAGPSLNLWIEWTEE